MILGFTGTRSGLTAWQKNELQKLTVHLDPSEVHHGDCVGADAEFDGIVYTLTKSWIHIHPAMFEKMRAHCAESRGGVRTVVHPPHPPLKRNDHIVSRSEYLIGCPRGMNEELRSGTWYTIRHARKAAHPITIIFPDGTMKHERL